MKPFAILVLESLMVKRLGNRDELLTAIDALQQHSKGFEVFRWCAAMNSYQRCEVEGL